MRVDSGIVDSDETVVDTELSNPIAASHPVQQRRLIFPAMLLVLATALVYLPTIRNGFVNFDDNDYVTQNPHVLRGLSWANVPWAFGTNNPAANWHPLAWLSHMVDVSLFGMNPAGHHLSNVMLHSFSVGILFLFLTRETGRSWCSAAVAMLFAIHPLNVESVAWIAERKAVLCMFFFTLTLLAYGWYVRKPSAMRYVCMVFLFVFALLSKVVAVTLPFALLLLDYWPLRRFGSTEDSYSAASSPRREKFQRLLLEKFPMLLLALACALMTVYMHGKDHALAKAFPLSWRVKNVLYSYAVYLSKAMWPSRLAVFYPHPENSLRWLIVILAGLGLVAVSCLAWRFRRRGYLFVGWFWFLGTMLPMIGIVQSGRQGMADRYMYIPIFGLLVAMVWLARDVARYMQFARAFIVTILALALAGCVYGTEVQIGYWKNSYTLFSHTLVVTENNGIAENNLGSALMEMGQPQVAAGHFATATRLIPNLSSAHYNLGVVLQIENKPEESARQYRWALATSTDPLEQAHIHNNMGALFLALEDYPEARKELNTAIVLNPDELNSYIGLGQVEMHFGNFDGAIGDFVRAARTGASPVGWFWLGRAFEANGDASRAAQAYAAAVRLAPQFADAQKRLTELRAKASQ